MYDVNIKAKQKLEKSMGIYKCIIILIFFIYQIIFLTTISILAKKTCTGIYTIYLIIQILGTIYVLNSHNNRSYKLTWVTIVNLLPILGLITYFLIGNIRFKKSNLYKFNKINEKVNNMDIFDRTQTIEYLEEVRELNESRYKEARYLNNVTNASIYKNQELKYLELGDIFFNDLKVELKKASKYILIQFFIISDGKLLNEILEILDEKVKSGVKVQIIMDHLGSASKVSKETLKHIEQIGIEIHKFKIYNSKLTNRLNYLEHKKVIVIDGIVAYSGGINLADEYVNYINKYGKWKDNGIKVIGEAATSYTLMFLKVLDYIISEFNKPLDYNWYLNIAKEQLKIYNKNNNKLSNSENENYLVCFEDGPNNLIHPSKNIFLQAINNAKNSICVTAPYLTLDEITLNAIINSVKSGVDFKIIIPYIPDKKLVYSMSEAYFNILLESGVEIYQYMPGFIHAKTLLIDDDFVILSTANLDFRSLHTNFECSAWMYNKDIAKEVKKDITKILEECIKIELNDWNKRGYLKKLLEKIYRDFSPIA